MKDNNYLENKLQELQSQYPLLQIKSRGADSVVIEGKIQMDAEFEGIRLFDEYELKLIIPNDFPNVLPSVYEVSNSVPIEFEHFLDDGALCLGVQGDLWERFANNQTLVYFFNEFVISYLYSVTYLKRYGVYPFGEFAHGVQGIVDFYIERLHCNDLEKIFEILRCCCNPNYKYRGHLACPCGSGKTTRNCHGDFMLNVIKHKLGKMYMYDCYSIYNLVKEIRK